jgi:hypothetical protein
VRASCILIRKNKKEFQNLVVAAALRFVSDFDILSSISHNIFQETKEERKSTAEYFQFIVSFEDFEMSGCRDEDKRKCPKFVPVVPAPA